VARRGDLDGCRSSKSRRSFECRLADFEMPRLQQRALPQWEASISRRSIVRCAVLAVGTYKPKSGTETERLQHRPGGSARMGRLSRAGTV
jgi:hypothetical protein